MAKPKNTGLGRGLDAIFLDNETENGSRTMLRLSEIEPRSGQPRKTFDAEALTQLADSIAANGMIQPIAVRDEENGFYQIIAGERRWRAAKMAGLTEVPVVIMDIDERKAAELALVENIQREDLTPVEEAAAYRALIEEYDMTQEEVSRRIGKSRSAITNALRLLDLPESVLAMLEAGTLSAGHARTLLGLKRPEDIEPTAETAVKKGLSVRALENLVRTLNHAAETPAPSAPAAPAYDYAMALERRIRAESGRHVHISEKKKRIEIGYADNEDLEKIIRSICGDSVFSEEI